MIGNYKENGFNRLANHIVYESGPIDFCPDGGKIWRKDMTEFFHSLKIKVFDPTNKPIGEQEDPSLTLKLNQFKIHGNYDLVTQITKNIVRTDLHILDLSNFVIAYIDTKLHLCGTYSEITYAALEKKPVIIVCKQGKQAIPNWIFGLGLRHQMFFSSFEEAKNYIKYIAYSSTIDDLGEWKFIDYDKV